MPVHSPARAGSNERPDKESIVEQDPARKSELSSLDADFIRVLEDLIDTLVANGTIRLTDLPPEAIAKLNQRKSARRRLRDSLDLIEDEDNLL